MADYLRVPMPDFVRASDFLGGLAGRARLAMLRGRAASADGLQAASAWIAERRSYYATHGWCGAPLGAAGVIGILAYFDNAVLIALFAGVAALPASLAVFFKIDEPARLRLAAAEAEYNAPS